MRCADDRGNMHQVLRKDHEREVWVMDEGKLGIGSSYIWGIRETDKKQVFIIINETTGEEKAFEGISGKP